MRRSALFCALALIAAQAPPAGARSLVVDDDRANCPSATFSRIQDAIDAAFPGEVVHVCAGTYPEQLLVSKPIQIHGVPGARVAPVGMVANTTNPLSGAPIAAIAVVTRNATLDRLEFDASASGFSDCTTAPQVMGIFFRGTSGSVRRSEVHDIPCPNGTGVVVQGVGPLIQVAVVGNFVHDYAQAGVVVSQYGAQAKIDSNTVRGAGSTTDRMQNGIQVGSNALAKVRRNIVQSNAGPSGSECLIDSGNIFFNSSRGVISGNTFTGNAAGVLVTGSRNRITDNTLDGMSGTETLGLIGISVTGHDNLVADNRVSNMSEVGLRLDGDTNRVLRNTINGTHEGTLCASVRALPACTDAMTTCGVGLWLAGGSGSVLVGNALIDNDTDQSQ